MELKDSTYQMQIWPDVYVWKGAMVEWSSSMDCIASRFPRTNKLVHART